jgi:DNA-binding Xre family transcriptional regulator
LKNIGLKVKEKRGVTGLRETAKAIGISLATLSRIENGKVPDLETFSKLCKWLELDPADMMGIQPKKDIHSQQVSVHFKKDDAVEIDTAKALATMIMAAQRAFQNRKQSN